MGLSLIEQRSTAHAQQQQRSHELQSKMVDWQGERTYLSAFVKRGRNLSYFVGRLAALCVARLLSTRPPA